jgi:hypothetical protein
VRRVERLAAAADLPGRRVGVRNRRCGERLIVGQAERNGQELMRERGWETGLGAGVGFGVAAERMRRAKGSGSLGWR